LPLAFHVCLLLIALACGFGAVRIAACAGLLLILGHLVQTIALGGTRQEAAALCLAPFYILWKIFLIPGMLRSSRRKAEWLRTERAAEKGTK
jgi:hypothetical protein